MVNVRATLSRWYATISSTPWASWISHGVLAFLLVTLFHHPFAIATFYVLREVEQASLELLYRKPVNVVDHILDALVPVLVVTGWHLL